MSLWVDDIFFETAGGELVGAGGRGHFWIFVIMKVFDDRKCNKEKKKTIPVRCEL